MGVHISGVVQFSCNTVEIAHTIIFLIITGAVSVIVSFIRVGQDRLVFSAVCLNLRTCERWLLLHPAKVRMPRAAIITVSLFIINRYFEAKVNYKFEQSKWIFVFISKFVQTKK